MSYISYIPIAVNIGLFSVSTLVYHRIIYSHNMSIRQSLINDHTDKNILEKYDKWLESGFVNQLFNNPIRYKN